MELSKGDIVSFSIYVPDPLIGAPPLFNYTGKGMYLGACADGHMTRATECTKPENIGEVIFTRNKPSLVKGIAA